VVTAGSDGTVRIWDWKTEEPLTELSGTRASISPDGAALLTLGRDVVRISDCVACGPSAMLMARACESIVRGLTFAERERYLHESSALASSLQNSNPCR
jgi:hypothetical protein